MSANITKQYSCVCVCVIGGVEWCLLVWSGASQLLQTGMFVNCCTTSWRNHSTKWRGPEMVWLVRRTAKPLAPAEKWTSDHPACCLAMYKQLSLCKGPAVLQLHAKQCHNQRTVCYNSNYVLHKTATAVTYFNMLFLAGIRFLVVYSTSRFPFSFFLLCCLLLLSVFLILWN